MHPCFGFSELTVVCEQLYDFKIEASWFDFHVFYSSLVTYIFMYFGI